MADPPETAAAAACLDDSSSADSKGSPNALQQTFASLALACKQLHALTATRKCPLIALNVNQVDSQVDSDPSKLQDLRQSCLQILQLRDLLLGYTQDSQSRNRFSLLECSGTELAKAGQLAKSPAS